MTEPGCTKDKQWCRGLTALCGVLTLIVLIMSMYMVFQEGRLVNLEKKNDTIVELRTDMSYVKRDVAEIKTILRAGK